MRFHTTVGAGLRRLARDRRGAAVIEAALILPMLLLLMAGLLDGGRAILQQMQLQSAAQAGADYARAHAGDVSGSDEAALSATSLVVNLTPAPYLQEGCSTPAGITPAKKHKDKCPGNAEPGTFAIVTAQANFVPIMPWPGLNFGGGMQAKAAVRVD